MGRAANLNEDQITELAKLPCGVAAVYQNEWIQPVLCKVDLFAAPEKPFMIFDFSAFKSVLLPLLRISFSIMQFKRDSSTSVLQ